MVTIHTQEFSSQRWHEVVLQFDDTSLIQLWEYGEAKALTAGWEVVRHTFYDGETLVGAAQAAVKRVPYTGKGVVWVNRGPLWQRKGAPGRPESLQEMLIELRRYWVDTRAMYLRIAPPCVGNVSWRSCIQQARLRDTSVLGWSSARIDLTQPLAALQAVLKKKWRNGLAKAEKLGLSYEIGRDERSMEELIQDYRALLAQKEFASVTPEFLITMQRMLPEHRKMWVLRGRLGPTKLGSILIACHGVTAEYLVGAVGAEGRSLNAGQFLLWNALREMQARGFTVFDIGGADPQKTPPGILHFKEGLGGAPYRFVGEFDCARGIVARGIRRIVMARM